MRGRKYRNSVRPNRVTGSGFWKATGIDKPIYKPGGCSDCIGLKKSLVYYLGSAGKCQKTNWMMHEFRLPSNWDGVDAEEAVSSKVLRFFSAQDQDPHFFLLEQEAWTVCRIFKRTVSWKRYAPPQRWESPAPITDSSSKTSSEESGGLMDATPVQNFIEENVWHQLSSSVRDSPLIIHESACNLFFENGGDDIGKMMEIGAYPSSLLLNVCTLTCPLNMRESNLAEWWTHLKFTER